MKLKAILYNSLCAGIFWSSCNFLLLILLKVVVYPLYLQFAMPLLFDSGSSSYPYFRERFFYVLTFVVCIALVLCFSVLFGKKCLKNVGGPFLNFASLLILHVIFMLLLKVAIDSEYTMIQMINYPAYALDALISYWNFYEERTFLRSAVYEMHESFCLNVLLTLVPYVFMCLGLRQRRKQIKQTAHS